MRLIPGFGEHRQWPRIQRVLLDSSQEQPNFVITRTTRSTQYVSRGRGLLARVASNGQQTAIATLGGVLTHGLWEDGSLASSNELGEIWGETNDERGDMIFLERVALHDGRRGCCFQTKEDYIRSISRDGNIISTLARFKGLVDTNAYGPVEFEPDALTLGESGQIYLAAWWWRPSERDPKWTGLTKRASVWMLQPSGSSDEPKLDLLFDIPGASKEFHQDRSNEFAGKLDRNLTLKWSGKDRLILGHGQQFSILTPSGTSTRWEERRIAGLANSKEGQLDVVERSDGSFLAASPLLEQVFEVSSDGKVITPVAGMPPGPAAPNGGSTQLPENQLPPLPNTPVPPLSHKIAPRNIIPVDAGFFFVNGDDTLVYLGEEQPETIEEIHQAEEEIAEAELELRQASQELAEAKEELAQLSLMEKKAQARSREAEGQELEHVRNLAARVRDSKEVARADIKRCRRDMEIAEEDLALGREEFQVSNRYASLPLPISSGRLATNPMANEKRALERDIRHDIRSKREVTRQIATEKRGKIRDQRSAALRESVAPVPFGGNEVHSVGHEFEGVSGSERVDCENVDVAPAAQVLKQMRRNAEERTRINAEFIEEQRELRRNAQQEESKLEQERVRLEKERVRAERLEREAKRLQAGREAVRRLGTQMAQDSVSDINVASERGVTIVGARGEAAMQRLTEVAAGARQTLRSEAAEIQSSIATQTEAAAGRLRAIRPVFPSAARK